MHEWLDEILRGEGRDEEREGLLRRFLRKHLRMPECEHSYPEVHRIGDVRLDGECFRIVRCVTCGELRAMCIGEEICFEGDLGVSLKLEGEELERWLVEARRKNEEEAGGR